MDTRQTKWIALLFTFSTLIHWKMKGMWNLFQLFKVKFLITTIDFDRIRSDLWLLLIICGPSLCYNRSSGLRVVHWQSLSLSLGNEKARKRTRSSCRYIWIWAGTCNGFSRTSWKISLGRTTKMERRFRWIFRIRKYRGRIRQTSWENGGWWVEIR